MRTRVNRAWVGMAPLWLAVSLVTVISVSAVQTEDLTYTTNNGSITITGYTGTGSVVNIPEMINGLSVTRIQALALARCATLTRVVIGNSVTNIGSDAFYHSTGLTSIAVSAGNSSFSSVDGLLLDKAKTRVIKCPEGMLGHVTIPNSVTDVGYRSFWYCLGLASVTIPDSVASIGAYAFYWCPVMTNATIPDSVTNIGDSAFSHCGALTDVNIGNSVARIGAYAFFGCASLTNVTVVAANAAYRSTNGVLFNKTTTTLIQCPPGRCGHYAMPNSTTHIGDYAFYGCAKLTDVEVSGSVANIGAYAFYGCDYVTNVTMLPSSVTNIGGYAFHGCARLMGITVDALNGKYASDDGILFNKDKTVLLQCPGGKIADITIPATVTNIGDFAFYDCSRLTGIAVDVLNGTYASDDGILFNKNKTVLLQCPGGKIGDITVPASVTNIGGYAFHGCSRLTGITADALNGKYASEDGILFNKAKTVLLQCPGGKIGDITVPATVTNIGDFAFYNCGLIEGVYFRGDAPGVSQPSMGFSRAPVFYGATNATIYYLPGTVGWGSTFDGCPLEEWRPKVNCDEKWGVRTNQCSFTINWASGMVAIVEACTNVTALFWSPLQTNILISDSLHFSDSDSSNYSVRFYRVSSP